MELFVYLEMRDGGQPTAVKGARVIIFRSNLAELPPPPMHYGLSPIERGQFRFVRFCMKMSLSLSNSMIFSFSPLLKTRKKC